MDFFKFDMHCHTSEGSPDSHVSIREYINILKEKGFGGMLVSDHNSYGGYESYVREEADKSFTVLKGIEYDTSDFGHMLIVMPDKEVPKVLYYRGLSLKNTIEVVHMHGGIIGAAHPCGEPFLSFFTSSFSAKKKILKHKLLKKLDFIEGYNACEPEDSNLFARMLAKLYHKPMTGGSDAHNSDCVGLAYAMLPSFIKSEQGLIEYIKSSPNIKIGGRRYGKTTKDKLGFFNHFLVYGFYYYNKFETIKNAHKRNFHLRGMKNENE